MKKTPEIRNLESQVHHERYVSNGLARRLKAHGGRTKAPRLFVAYRRHAHVLSLLEDRLRQAKHRAKKPPLRLRAYSIAAGQVGVMEAGPNNAGVPFERYEKANQAGGFEPWCGDFVAWCYRQAGSKRVQRAWASVALLRGVLGISQTHTPRTGDLVRFSFDHVGIFVRWVDNHTIETIEGNTGPSGAVSDSKTGGDGVYRKHRDISLVRDFLAVHG